jgi:hypothetical protein
LSFGWGDVSSDVRMGRVTISRSVQLLTARDTSHAPSLALNGSHPFDVKRDFDFDPGAQP